MMGRKFGRYSWRKFTQLNQCVSCACQHHVAAAAGVDSSMHAFCMYCNQSPSIRIRIAGCVCAQHIQWGAQGLLPWGGACRVQPRLSKLLLQDAGGLSVLLFNAGDLLYALSMSTACFRGALSSQHDAGELSVPLFDAGGVLQCFEHVDCNLDGSCRTILADLCNGRAVCHAS